MDTTSTDLAVGDRLRLRHGPWEATWQVVEIINAGAILECVGRATFVGFGNTSAAPNGDALTRDRGQTFIGRAHWHEHWPPPGRSA